jgi:hypothetical protein
VLYAGNGFNTAGVFTELKQSQPRPPATNQDTGIVGSGTWDCTWMQEMTRQLGNGFGVSEVMTTLVKDNRAVLERHVDQPLMRTFTTLIHEKGPQDTFLEFLCAVASCDGFRIAQNQERLLRTFYSSKSFEGRCRPEDLRNRKGNLSGYVFLIFAELSLPFCGCFVQILSLKLRPKLMATGRSIIPCTTPGRSRSCFFRRTGRTTTA